MFFIEISVCKEAMGKNEWWNVLKFSAEIFEHTSHNIVE